ncbi:MAG: phosphoribosylaminoimidazolesuccinocarboxamide synthase [Elusimicrobiales bacterium]|nr:phosphoribosylaminoimidazolesuccinocarboxamide synthase [Elusimicrobiales bacterium]
MKTNLSNFKTYKGKVRDVYHLDEEKILIVTTDRISAFDWILPNEIPYKGEVLTQLSVFWFNRTKNIVKNHLITSDIDEIYNITKVFLDDYYKKRTVLCYKAKRIDFEFIVRGYIFGTAWKEYEKNGSVCDIKLPKGLKYSQKLDEPIFTPTTKSDKAHDENVNFNYVSNKIGFELASKIKDISFRIYSFAHDFLLNKGIIIADTKFEFGILDGELILIDELLTPDSSRFWNASTFRVGIEPESYDKQIIRNYLLNTLWDRKSPPPSLPKDIIEKTSDKYIEIMKLIIGV